MERWGWASISLNIGLSALNLAVAHTSGSLAVAAEMVHNLVDLAASVVVLVGLKLSERKSDVFPYGLYKVENLVAAGISILIFVVAYELACEALFGEQRVPAVSAWILAGVLLSTLAPLIFSIFEMQAGRAGNSPCLIADAREYRVHVFTSGVVLAALLGVTVDLHLERIAALVVVAMVAKTGWELLNDAMRVLLDASLDAATLRDARGIIQRHPSVVRLLEIFGRNAGRYRFLEARVEVRVQELERAELVVRELEKDLRSQIPFMERVLITVRSTSREILRLALPLSAPHGPPDKHFGTAPYFLFVDLRSTDGSLGHREVVPNPFWGDPRGRGLKVAQWLIEHGVDVLLTPDDVGKKGPGYALREVGVEVLVVRKGDMDEALSEGARLLER